MPRWPRCAAPLSAPPDARGGCVEDYLSEKEQWEWVKTQVRENGPALILAVALAVAAVYGWRWWQEHLDVGRLAAGARYMQMVQALEHGDRSQALVLLGELERDDPGSPYTDQAKLLAARLHEVRGDAWYAKGDKSAALTEYRSARAASEAGAAALLDLKIADLAAGPAAPAPAPAAAVAR